MSSESGMPNNERLAYGAVLAKILLNLVNSDMEIEVSLVPPSLFFKLTKKLSVMSPNDFTLYRQPCGKLIQHFLLFLFAGVYRNDSKA